MELDLLAVLSGWIAFAGLSIYVLSSGKLTWKMFAAFLKELLEDSDIKDAVLDVLSNHKDKLPVSFVKEFEAHLDTHDKKKKKAAKKAKKEAEKESEDVKEKDIICEDEEKKGEKKEKPEKVEEKGVHPPGDMLQSIEVVKSGDDVDEILKEIEDDSKALIKKPEEEK